MIQTNIPPQQVDYASILYLSLMREEHANCYRFTMTMDEPVCPDTLQQAMNSIFPRFPMIFAGFKPGFFRFMQVPAQEPPKVQTEPGMIHTMTAEEIRNCPFRLIYDGNEISVELFHALADGYGAIACFSTLVGEYIRLKYGENVPAKSPLLDLADGPQNEEIHDYYPDYMQGPPVHLPSRYAYQLPGPKPSRTGIRTYTYTVDTDKILAAARSNDVSITNLISTVMALSVMEVQKRHEGAITTPARIMVPIDLRRQFPSRTLRNFILYALPTLEPENAGRPLGEICKDFARQMKELSRPELLASIMAYNVRTQANPLFRAIPLGLKSFAMKTAYRYFGESNSSITVTNLGNVTLPEEMNRHVRDIRVFLTPRTRSPYNCGVLAFGGKLHIIISRYAEELELEAIFTEKMEKALNGEEV